jgi:hypothetical protein
MKTTRWYLFIFLILTGLSVTANNPAPPTGPELKAEIAKWEEKFKAIAVQNNFAYANGNATITFSWIGTTRVMIITNNSTGGGTPKVMYTIPLFQNAASVLTLSPHATNHDRAYLNSIKPVTIETTNYVMSNGSYTVQPVVTTYSTKLDFKFIGKTSPNSMADANNALYNLCKAALNYYMWAGDRG